MSPTPERQLCFHELFYVIMASILFSTPTPPLCERRPHACPCLRRSAMFPALEGHPGKKGPFLRLAFQNMLKPSPGTK